MSTVRIPELDGVRGILSLLVVSGHAYPAATPWFAGSMDFFFCISGFLITRILRQPAELSFGFLKTYAARRVLRIWPMYYFSLVLYFATSAWLVPLVDYQWHGLDLSWTFAWPPFLSALLFLQNTEVLAGLDRFVNPWLFGHSWSVAIEEQFYFLWPLIFLLYPKWSRSFKAVIAVLAVATAVVSRAVAYVEFDSDAIYMCILPSRLDSFTAGILLAFIVGSSQTPLQRVWVKRLLAFLASLSLALLLPSTAASYGAHWFPRMPALSRTIFDPALGCSILAFATLGLVVMHSGTASLRALRNRALMWLGTISYSTYLLHIFVLVAVSTAMKGLDIQNICLQWSLSMAMSVGVAHLTYTYIEARALALKGRFTYTERRGITA